MVFIKRPDKQQNKIMKIGKSRNKKVLLKIKDLWDKECKEQIKKSKIDKNSRIHLERIFNEVWDATVNIWTDTFNKTMLWK